MKREKQRIRERGIRIRTLNYIMVAVTAMMAVWLVVSNFNLEREYTLQQEAQERYTQCEKNAQILQETTDNLRKQVQYFSQTGEKTYVTMYFKEALSGNKERAIEELQATEREQAVLSQAKEESDKIMKIEYRIIRLVSSANGIAGIITTEEYNDYHLTKEESLMSPSKKMQIARSLAFNSQYLQYSSDVSSHIKMFSQMILKNRQAEVEAYSEMISGHIKNQYIMTGVLVVVIFAVIFLYYVKVSVVIRKYMRSIMQDDLLTKTGVRELRYFAGAYNENAKKKMEQEKKLRFRADFDALTGVSNRGAFEKYVEERLADENRIDGSFLLVDVDKFKFVNDGYGHEVGDTVLKNVAEALRDKFRSQDVVGRLGGDEFAVWIDGASEKRASYISERIKEINAELGQPEEGMPVVSISVGISFAEKGDIFKDIYKKSDEALYTVKEHGRCGCAVYEKK